VEDAAEAHGALYKGRSVGTQHDRGPHYSLSSKSSSTISNLHMSSLGGVEYCGKNTFDNCLVQVSKLMVLPFFSACPQVVMASQDGIANFDHSLHVGNIKDAFFLHHVIFS
jgi:hypothetical protein